MRRDLLKARYLGVGLAVLATACGLGGAATAQELSEVVVTARRVAERLQDVPISMAVYNQETLTHQNVVSSQDLALFTPSLTAQNFSGGTTSSFGIRGFNPPIGTDPTVGVYLAEAVAPRGFANLSAAGNGAAAGSFFDLQNVQVLKGPQGTLFGRNTTGGAILLVPAKPSDEFGGYVEGSVGNYSMKRVQAVLNAPLSDVARLRIGVDHNDREGYLHNNTGIGPDRFSDSRYTAGRASLVVDVTPDLENYLIATYSHIDQNGDAFKLIAANPATGLVGSLTAAQLVEFGADRYTLQNTVPNAKTKQKTWQVINTTTWIASENLTVKNILSYGELRSDIIGPTYGFAFNLRNIGFPNNAYVTLFSSQPLQDGHTAAQSTLTEEFRLQGTGFAGRLQWQTGGYFEQSNPLGVSGSLSQTFQNCEGASLTCNNISGFGSRGITVTKIHYRNLAAYAQGIYSLTDTLKLTAGLRYTHDRTRGDAVYRTARYSGPRGVPQQPTAFTCNNPDVSTPPACLVSARNTSSAPTWLIGLDYKPTSDMLVYAKYTRGYRTGGLQLQAPSVFQKYSPEHVESYEAGVKARFDGFVHGTFNISGFYNDFSNQQLLLILQPKSPLNSQIAAIANAGKSTIYGIEAQGSLKLFKGFELNAAYTYLHTNIDALVLPTLPATSAYIVPPGQAQAVGDALAYSPSNQFMIAGTYTLPIDEEFGVVSLTMSWNHTGKQVAGYGDRDAAGKIIPPSVLDARNLVNASLNWENIANKPVDLSLFVTNLTKEHYYLNTSSQLPNIGFAVAAVGAPRMYGARLRVHFGN